jgi:hypothetical protein
MEFSFFITDNKSGYKTKESWLSKNHPELYEKILNYSSKFTLQLSFKERIWFYYNNLTERPKCVTCNSDVKFRERFDNPYGEFCSLLCINKNKEEMSKRQKNAFNLKYSVDYYPQHKDFINKQKKTKKEKYGSENYNNTEKSKITKFEKYGDENYNNLEKQKKTILNKYGKENIVYSDFYKEKISNSFKEKYKGIKINTIDGMLVSINCDKCGEDSLLTKQLLYERYKRNYDVCTICNPIGQNSRSGYENELSEFLLSKNVEVIQSYRGLPKKLEIDILKKTIEKLLNRQCSNNFTIQQIINNNNINNINNNLYVNINSLGKEDLSHITGKDYKKYVSGFFTGFIKFIEKIHFDKNMPENHNIYITNLKSKYTTIYDNENKKWLTKNKDEIIDNLIRKNYNILDGKCDEFEEKEINEDVIKKFRTFQKNYIDEESQKNTKDNVMLLLYNNRDKVEKVKKIK